MTPLIWYDAHVSYVLVWCIHNKQTYCTTEWFIRVIFTSTALFLQTLQAHKVVLCLLGMKISMVRKQADRWGLLVGSVCLRQHDYCLFFLDDDSHVKQSFTDAIPVSNSVLAALFLQTLQSHQSRLLSTGNENIDDYGTGK